MKKASKVRNGSFFFNFAFFSRPSSTASSDRVILASCFGLGLRVARLFSCPAAFPFNVLDRLSPILLFHYCCGSALRAFQRRSFFPYSTIDSSSGMGRLVFFQTFFSRCEAVSQSVDGGRKCKNAGEALS